MHVGDATTTPGGPALKQAFVCPRANHISLRQHGELTAWKGPNAIDGLETAEPDKCSFGISFVLECAFENKRNSKAAFMPFCSKSLFT